MIGDIQAYWQHIISSDIAKEDSWRIRHWDDLCNALKWGLMHDSEQALQMLQNLKQWLDDPEYPAFLDFLQALSLSSLENSLQAPVLSLSAYFLYHEQKTDHAYTTYQSALRLYEEVDDLENQVYIHHLMGRLAKKLGNLPTARNHYEREIALCEQLGKKSAQSIALRLLKNIAINQKDWNSAYRYLHQRLDLFIFLSNDMGITNLFDNSHDVLQDLGFVSAQLGYVDEARDCFARVLHESQNELLIAGRDILWEWGQLEYRLGNQQEGYALCALALVEAYRLYDVSGKNYQRCLDTALEFSQKLSQMAREMNS